MADAGSPRIVGNRKPLENSPDQVSVEHDGAAGSALAVMDL